MRNLSTQYVACACQRDLSEEYVRTTDNDTIISRRTWLLWDPVHHKTTRLVHMRLSVDHFARGRTTPIRHAKPEVKARRCQQRAELTSWEERQCQLHHLQRHQLSPQKGERAQGRHVLCAVVLCSLQHGNKHFSLPRPVQKEQSREATFEPKWLLCVSLGPCACTPASVYARIDLCHTFYTGHMSTSTMLIRCATVSQWYDDGTQGFGLRDRFTGRTDRTTTATLLPRASRVSPFKTYV